MKKRLPFAFAVVLGMASIAAPAAAAGEASVASKVVTESEFAEVSSSAAAEQAPNPKAKPSLSRRVPEPAGWTTMLVALAGLGAALKLSRRKKGRREDS